MVVLFDHKGNNSLPCIAKARPQTPGAATPRGFERGPESTGRRAEAEALHKRGVLPLRETLPSPRAGRRSLHLGGVNHLESQRPLRSHAFWSLEQLPADQQAVVKALELQYHDIADEAFAALSDPKFGLTEENLAEKTSHWRKFDIRRLGAVACFAWAVGGWWVSR